MDKLDWVLVILVITNILNFITIGLNIVMFRKNRK